MNLDGFLTWVGATWIGNTMRDIWWMWPFMENLHFFGLCLLFGALMVIDLRVLGVAKSIPMAPAMRLIPLALIAFAINLLTGIAFYAGDPFRYTFNTAFQWKMGLIAVAGLNALWFWFGEHAKLSRLAVGESADMQAKTIAALSLALWVVIIILGRLIPYLE